MTPPPKVIEAIYSAIDSINEQLDPGNRIPKSPDAVLLGPPAALDSLAMINFVIGLEQCIDQTFATQVSLTSDPDIFGADSPLRTVGTLAAYLVRTLPQSVLQ